MLPEEVPDALDHFRAPLSSIRDAKVVVVLCDEPVHERAPVVDLWIKAARRNGARILTELPEEQVEGAVLITDDAEHAAWFARDLGATAAFYLPLHAERARRRRRLELRRRRRAGRREPTLLVDLRRRGRRRPGRARARRSDAEVVIGIGMFEESLPRARRPRPARARATSSATARPSTSRAGCSASAAP